MTVSAQGAGSFGGSDADRTVVWLQGEHDAFTVASLSESLDRAIALDDADVVIDLSGVQFMGAATVGVIIMAREGLRLRSRSLSLRSPSRCAWRILDLCGVADLVDPDPRLLDTAHMEGAAGIRGAAPADAPQSSVGRALLHLREFAFGNDIGACSSVSGVGGRPDRRSR